MNMRTYVRCRSYVELHAHSAFSFLDGVSTPEELADAGAAAGYAAMALTDHDGLCGSLAFAYAARDAGVQPITGCEITLADHSHLTLLAASATGYANLCRLVTLAHADTRRRAIAAPCRRGSTPELIGPLADGLICLTGCARHGLIPRLIAAGQRPRRRRMARAPARMVPAGAPVHRTPAPPSPRQPRAGAGVAGAGAQRPECPLVATGDVHAHHPHRAFLQDAFVAIGHRQTLDGPSRSGAATAPRSSEPPSGWQTLFAEVPEAVRATGEIAARCSFDLTRDLGYRFPDFVAGHPGEPHARHSHASALPARVSTIPTPRRAQSPARASTRSSRSSSTTAWRGSSSCTATSSSWHARSRCRYARRDPPDASCRRAAAAAPRWARSSAT